MPFLRSRTTRALGETIIAGLKVNLVKTCKVNVQQMLERLNYFHHFFSSNLALRSDRESFKSGYFFPNTAILAVNMQSLAMNLSQSHEKIIELQLTRCLNNRFEAFDMQLAPAYCSRNLIKLLYNEAEV